MIKLVTIDLDGTLFDDEKNISKENIDAIKKAHEMGVKVVIATGRPLSGIIPTLEKLGLTSTSDYLISYNGARVQNIGTKEIIFNRFLTGKDLKIINNLAKLFNVNIHAFTKNEELITPKHNPYTNRAANLNHLESKEVSFDSIDDNELFIKILLVDQDYNLDYIEENMEEKYFKAYSIVRSCKIFLEFLNKEVDKGLALVALANYLNIPLSDTMAIGDAGNDLSMIVKAGIGVAMGNSFSYVKDAADFITKDNLHSGVAYAFNKFVFK